MEEQFVTYEIALKLKELWFDEECFGYFRNRDKFLCLGADSRVQRDSTLAPLWQQVIDWFREKRDIHLYLPKSVYGGYVYVVDAKYSDTIYANFYDAREQAILKAIELCKNK